jgi:hypothetical protein
MTSRRRYRSAVGGQQHAAEQRGQERQRVRHRGPGGGVGPAVDQHREGDPGQLVAADGQQLGQPQRAELTLPQDGAEPAP